MEEKQAVKDAIMKAADLVQKSILRSTSLGGASSPPATPGPPLDVLLRAELDSIFERLK